MEIYLVIIVITLIIIIVAIYNNLIFLKNQVQNAKSSVDVYLKKRFDLIPNLVETIKGYKKHEEELLTKIAMFRSLYDENNTGMNLKNNAEYNKDISLLVEKYPELKASEMFGKLFEELTLLENDLQASRRFLNSAITDYNTNIHTFPIIIFSKIMGFKDYEIFKTNEYEKENVNIKL